MNELLIQFYVNMLKKLIIDPSYVAIYTDFIWQQNLDPPVTTESIELGFVSGNKIDTELWNLLLYWITRFNNTHTTLVKSRYQSIYNELTIIIAGLDNKKSASIIPLANPSTGEFVSPDIILPFGTDPATELYNEEGALAIYPESYIAMGYEYDQFIYAPYENNWFIRITNQINSFFNIEGSSTIYKHNVTNLDPDESIVFSDGSLWLDSNNQPILYTDYLLITDKYTENNFVEDLFTVMQEVISKLPSLDKIVVNDIVNRSTLVTPSVIWGESNEGKLKVFYEQQGYTDNFIIDPAYHNYIRNINDDYLLNKYQLYLNFRDALKAKNYTAGFSQKRKYTEVLLIIMNRINDLL